MAYGPDSSIIKGDLESGCEFLRSRDAITFPILEELEVMSLNSVSRAALIAAAVHTLSARNRRFPWEIFDLEPPRMISTSFTVSLDDPENMVREIAASPYPIIKIKLGNENDENLLKALDIISGKRFRIDVNEAWTAEKTERMMHYLNRLEVDIVEQPTGPESIREWKYLRKRSSVKFIMDEGLNRLEDYEKYCDFIDGVNIKMAKSGGILEAIRIARRAKKDKLAVMFGCMVESQVGIAPALYCGSLGDYFDFDGPLLLADDMATGIKFNVEKVSVDEDIIGGPRLKDKYRKDD